MASVRCVAAVLLVAGWVALVAAGHASVALDAQLLVTFGAVVAAKP